MALVPPLSITAIGLVNGMGRTTADVLTALAEGRAGLAAPEIPLPFPTLVGGVPGELAPLPERWARYDTRLARIGMMALAEVSEPLTRCVERWGRHRVGIFVGTSTGGLDATEVAYQTWARQGTLPATFELSTQHDFNALGELYAAVLGVSGPVYVVSTACSSSGKVHASAARMIRAGLIDAALVGGIDSLCRMTLHGFFGLGILSASACRPFSAERKGINIGEGAALMLLEREASSPLAELRGVGESSDAYNMSSPEPSGRGAQQAMRRALAQAGSTPSDVGLVIAHGTATDQNDAAESIAIQTVFGRDDAGPVVSTKGYTGHQLGAAGATSAAFAVHALRTSTVFASLGVEPKDPKIAIDVPATARAQNLDLVLANAFAFGGSNVCLAIGRAR